MSYALNEIESSDRTDFPRISGWVKTTLLDFPGKVASTLFLEGCNFRCPYCHNPELVVPPSEKNKLLFDIEEIFTYLSIHRKMLEGICISGGEPLMQKGLFNLCGRLRRMGLKIKLDTNGSHPRRLQLLLDNNLLDYVAVDIKGPPHKIDSIARPVVCEQNLANKIETTVAILKQAGQAFELRTTVVPGLLEADDLTAIGSWLTGCPKFVLQQFSSKKTLDPFFQDLPTYPPQYLRDAAARLSGYFDECTVRGID